MMTKEILIRKFQFLINSELYTPINLHMVIKLMIVKNYFLTLKFLSW